MHFFSIEIGFVAKLAEQNVIRESLCPQFRDFFSRERFCPYSNCPKTAILELILRENLSWPLDQILSNVSSRCDQDGGKGELSGKICPVWISLLCILEVATSRFLVLKAAFLYLAIISYPLQISIDLLALRK